MNFWKRLNSSVGKDVSDQDLIDMKRSVLLKCPHGTTVKELAAILPNDAVIVGMQSGNDLLESFEGFTLKVWSMTYAPTPEGMYYPVRFLDNGHVVEIPPGM